MLDRFVELVRVPRLRRKLLVTLVAVVLFRVAVNVPAPWVDVDVLESAERAREGHYASQLLAGSALLGLSVLGLGFLPVGAAHLVAQALTWLVPRLRPLRAEGSAGRAPLARYTWWAVVALGAVQGVALALLAANNQLLPGFSADEDVLRDPSVLAQAAIAAAMTAGSVFVHWLSRLISTRGFGDGLAILGLAQVAAVFPRQVADAARELGGGAAYVLLPLLILATLTLLTVSVITTSQAVREIPLQQAKRTIGRRAFGGMPTYLPIRGNAGGFRSLTLIAGLLLIPAPLPVLLVPYVLLVVFHVYVRALLDLDIVKVTNDLRKYGLFVPGIRPGPATAAYLGYVQRRIALATALFLGVVALIPVAALAPLGAYDFAFSATTLVLVASTAMHTSLATARQMEGQVLQHTFAAYLR